MALLSLVLLLAGCGSPDRDTTASTASCKPGRLTTEQPGVLTVATDKQTRPPYFKDDDPTNGEGFESAVAYAIADQLGYPAAKVRWVSPSRALAAPGPKNFDLALSQIQISPAREEAVDFSSRYYTVTQAVVALKKTRWLEPDFLLSLELVKMGVLKDSSSPEAIERLIAPREALALFDKRDEAVEALEEERVEALVLELPAALPLPAQLPQSHLIAQFRAREGDQWGAVLEEGSPITPCVSMAIEELRASGALERITHRWMYRATGVPLLD